MNPTSVMKLMNAKKKFSEKHPKFTAFCRDFFSRGIQAGTIIEITVIRPGEEPVTSNMRVQQEDLDLLKSLQDLAN